MNIAESPATSKKRNCDTPLVSIVIANYNYERFVGDAIQSALDQTYSNIEIIVIDDGSTDGSLEVIRSFEEQGIIVIARENLGQAAGFNAGFARSTGQTILFLDSDDALMPKAVETLMNRWHAGCSKAQFRLATIDDRGRFLGNVFPSYPADLTQDALRESLLATGGYISPPTSGNLFAREFLSEVLPLDTEVHCGPGDGPILTVAPLCGDILVVDEVLGYYRMHGKNNSSVAQFTAAQFAHRIELEEKRMGFLVDFAERKGVSIDPSIVERDAKNLSYRLARMKLEPVREGSLLNLAGKAIRALPFGNDGLGSRLALGLWILALTVSPEPLAKRLIAYRFVPASRPDWFRRALRRFGVGLAPKDSSEFHLHAQRSAA